MTGVRNKIASALSRRRFVTLSSVGLAMPAILRYSRAYAQERVFKVGYSSALTGAHASTAEADPFVLGKIKAILGDGVENNGRRVKIEILDRDTGSLYASDVAQDLIFGEQVDLIAATSTPNNVIPVADLAEVNGVPCITTDSPWQPFFFGRRGDPAVGFDWTYHFNWGLEDMIAAFVAFWQTTDVEKIVGGLFSDSPDAAGWTSPKNGFPAALQKAGFTWVQPPFYQNLFGSRSPSSDKQPANDFFNRQIAAFKDANCEILTANMSPEEYALFWDQARILEFRPKIATIARGLLFPSDIGKLGDRADLKSVEVWWAPAFPFRSSLTGQLAQELADSYTAETGRPWTMELGYKHALFEIIADVIKRTDDLDDPRAVVDAIAKTKLATIIGPIEWTGKPNKNVAKTPLVVGQWHKRADGFELVIVDSTTHPEIPVGGTLELLT